VKGENTDLYSCHINPISRPPRAGFDFTNELIGIMVGSNTVNLPGPE